MAENNMSYFIIVGLVAIVGIVAMAMMVSSNKASVSTPTTPDSDVLVVDENGNMVGFGSSFDSPTRGPKPILNQQVDGNSGGGCITVRQINDGYYREQSTACTFERNPDGTFSCNGIGCSSGSCNSNGFSGSYDACPCGFWSHFFGQC